MQRRNPNNKHPKTGYVAPNFSLGTKRALKALIIDLN